MNGFDSFILWLRNILSPVLSLPNSSLFIFILTFCLVLFVMIVNRLVTDIKKLQSYDLEIKKHTSDLKEAKEMNNKTALRRLKREDVRLKQLRAYVSKQRLKVTFITIMPIMAIYVVTSFIYYGQPAAIFPFDLPSIGRVIPFSIWYLLCYLTMYLPLSRLFGISPR